MFSKKALTFLKELVACRAPSGFEQDGQRLLARYVRSAGVESAFDVHGNLHAVLNEGAPTKVMLEAHCDEIGFLVSYIDDNGFLYLIPNGGVTVQTVAGERVVIQGRQGPVNGVFGVRPPHLMTAKEREKVAPTDLSEVSCRGFDNRIGAFIAAEVVRRLAEEPLAPLNVALHLVGSVQEELGLIGGQTAAYQVNPDIGICLDVGFATDATPADRRKMGDVRLGGGPILGVGPLYNPKLRTLLEAAARQEGIALQPQVRARASGNNAYSMRMQRGGAAVALISIPLRYMHSPVEVVDLADVEQIVRLLCAFIGALPAKPDLTPEL